MGGNDKRWQHVSWLMFLCVCVLLLFIAWDYFGRSELQKNPTSDTTGQSIEWVSHDTTPAMRPESSQQPEENPVMPSVKLPEKQTDTSKETFKTPFVFSMRLAGALPGHQRTGVQATEIGLVDLARLLNLMHVENFNGSAFSGSTIDELQARAAERSRIAELRAEKIEEIERIVSEIAASKNLALVIDTSAETAEGTPLLLNQDHATDITDLVAQQLPH